MHVSDLTAGVLSQSLIYVKDLHRAVHISFRTQIFPTFMPNIQTTPVCEKHYRRIYCILV